MNPCDEATANLNVQLQKLANQLDGNRAIYVSAPINTGWRFLAWYKMTGHALKSKNLYEAVHARDVVAQNRAEVLDKIDSIRRQHHPTPVVEPVTFAVAGWTQSDYRCYWGKVIERFIDQSIFLDGWEASVGCVYEFTVAKRVGVSTLDQRGINITAQRAISKIEAAIREMKMLRLDTNLLDAAVDELQPRKQRAHAGKRR
jgi:hypothetical protein